MNIMQIKEDEYMTLWTRQVAEIMKEIDENGVYRVKEEYIRKKNDTISDYYFKLYKWFTREAKKYIEVKAEYPIWLSVADEFRLRPVEGTVTLKLKVPSKEVLLCNYDAWGYVVNYFYLPLDEEDKAKHKGEIVKYGLASDDDKRVPKPEQAESPVWIYADEAAVFKSTGATLLKLSIPKEEIIFFDLRDWNKILNLNFLGSEEEEKKFKEKLKSQGVKDNLDIIKSPFYPLLKKELVESWKKLFNRSNLCKKYTEGAVWQLKKEWIIEKYRI